MSDVLLVESNGTLPQESTTKINSIPSVDNTQRNLNAIISSKNKVSLHETAIAMNITVSDAALDRVRFMTANFDGLSNYARTRLVSIAFANEVMAGSNSMDNASAAKVMDLLMSDYAKRKETQATIRTTEEDYTPDLATERDLQYLRLHGGTVLEQMYRSKRISKSQAVAFASVMETGEYDMTPLDRARAISFIVAHQDLSKINMFDNDIGNLVADTLMRAHALESVQAQSANPDRVPLANFVGIAVSANNEFRDCFTNDSMRMLVEAIVEKDKMPTEIQNLTQILDITRNHPEIEAVSFDMYDTLVQWSSGQEERRDRMDTLAVTILEEKYGITLTEAEFAQISREAWRKRWDEFQAAGNEVKIEETMKWMLDDVIRLKNITHLQDQVQGQSRGVAKLWNRFVTKSEPANNASQLRNQIVQDLVKSWYTVELETACAMPGALDTLRQLNAMGVKVALTSNASWSGEHIRRVLHKFGLLEYFYNFDRNNLDQAAISYSSQMGKMKKPHITDFFHYSWDKLGVSGYDRIIHVGDNPWDDAMGGKNAGANAIQYNNPDLTAYRDLDKADFYHNNYSGYAERALQAHLYSQNQEAKAEIDQMMENYHVPAHERARMREMAQEIYHKSREVTGPAYLALVDQQLKRLANGEMDMMLCLARDGLGMAVVAKLMRFLEPDVYKGVKADQIKYMHVSRAFVDRFDDDAQFRETYKKYIKQLGIDKAKKVILTDQICGSGKTFLKFEALLKDLDPAKVVDGQFLDISEYARLNVPHVHGFLQDNGNAGINLDPYNMLLVFEALYNGPYSSATAIEDKKRGVGPKIARKNPTENVAARGYSRESLLLLNQVAIKGLMDAAQNLHRRRLLGYQDQNPVDVAQTFQKFITDQPSPTWINIWRSIPWEDHGDWYLAAAHAGESGIFGAFNEKIVVGAGGQ